MEAIKSGTEASRTILSAITFKTVLILSVLFLVPAGRVISQPPADEEQKLSLLFIGDIMGHDTQIRAAWDPETKSYNYDDQFRYVRPIIESCDFTAANLEVTLAGPPYRGYPQFSSPPALAAACMNAGIECLFTANNHTADRGNRGILSTISRLDSLGIMHTGIFRDKLSADSLQPLMINKNGISVAFLNYTYGTNGIPVPPPVVVNMLDKEKIAADIEKAGALNPDLLVLALHWGVEYDTIPSEEQTKLANYFFYRGADLIIGSHPHVLQKMIWKKDNPIFRNKAIAYSLGNFVSNQRKPLTDGGSMVRIEVARRDSSVVITDAGYYLTWVYTPVENGRRNFYILPCNEFENKAEFFQDKNDFLQMQRFIKTSRSLLNRHNEGFRELFRKDFAGKRE
ncbi:MAG: CapA family protein [Bacteroidales bacterium]|jgi:poly-gamma-glutamate synthesis protein (capsule biosynthesis protein)|nr:CapA family protein [Bacteroidales bacterium]